MNPEREKIDRMAFYAARLMADGRWHSLEDLKKAVPFDADKYLFGRDLIMRMHHYLEPEKIIVTDGPAYRGFRIADKPKTLRMNKKELEDALLEILKDGDWHTFEEIHRVLIGNYYQPHSGSSQTSKVFNAYRSLKAKEPILEFDDYIDGHPVWMIRYDKRNHN